MMNNRQTTTENSFSSSSSASSMQDSSSLSSSSSSAPCTQSTTSTVNRPANGNQLRQSKQPKGITYLMVVDRLLPVFQADFIEVVEKNIPRWLIEEPKLRKFLNNWAKQIQITSEKLLNPEGLNNGIAKEIIVQWKWTKDRQKYTADCLQLAEHLREAKETVRDTSVVPSTPAPTASLSSPPTTFSLRRPTDNKSEPSAPPNPALDLAIIRELHQYILNALIEQEKMIEIWKRKAPQLNAPLTKYLKELTIRIEQLENHRETITPEQAVHLVEMWIAVATDPADYLREELAITTTSQSSSSTSPLVSHSLLSTPSSFSSPSSSSSSTPSSLSPSKRG